MNFSHGEGARGLDVGGTVTDFRRALMAWGFQCCTGLTKCRSCVAAFPPTAMKRDLSDMDSDCDDVFAEDSKGTPSQSNDSCQMLNRKRRRGIIEKRRRDRINNSLSELRRLVPAAFEKQGSAKLEKAEILQMTVDHLKMLHAKGFDALSFDPHKFAMDYHSIGFRECASEVARYLVAMEGMDLQDPLRLRLMSHLQCYAAQRELALKTSSVHSPWNPSSSFTSVPPAPAPQYPPPMGHPATMTAGGPGSVSVASEAPQSLSANVSSYSCAEPRLAQTVPMDNNTLGTNSHYSRVPPAPNTSMPSASMPPSLVNNGNMSMVPSLSQMPTNHQYLGGHSFSTGGYGSSGHISQHTSSTGRPYRPWGSELVY